MTKCDDYHGIKVADPYRWLEDDNSAETLAWVKAQNQVTHNYLEQIPYRSQLKQRLQELYNYPKYGIPSRSGAYYLWSKNDGLQNQSVLYVQKGLEGTPRVLIDPNQLSPDGTVRLMAGEASRDGRYFAYYLSSGGSDWLDGHVLEIETGKVLRGPPQLAEGDWPCLVWRWFLLQPIRRAPGRPRSFFAQRRPPGLLPSPGHQRKQTTG